MENIVLLGAPGSGKGTLAKQLEDLFYKVSVTPGELYRKEASLGTEFGLAAKKYWGDGNLCPDEMTNELIRKTISESNAFHNGWIFDGYPRTKAQAEYLDSVTAIDLVINLSITDDTAIKRLLRRACIENRSDDTDEIIKQRLKVYHNNNQDIINYYAMSPRYVELNGEGTIDNTMSLAVKVIEQ